MRTRADLNFRSVARRVLPLLALLILALSCGTVINGRDEADMDATTGIALWNRSPYTVDVWVTTPAAALKIVRSLGPFARTRVRVPDIFINGRGDIACIYLVAYATNTRMSLGHSPCLGVRRGRMDNPITIQRPAPSTGDRAG